MHGRCRKAAFGVGFGNPIYDFGCVHGESPPSAFLSLTVGTNVGTIDGGFCLDEAKRERVLAERGIDFLRIAFALFDGRPLLTVPTPRDDEERFLSVGSMEGKFFAVVWTWRDNAVRIITARRARDEEEKRYRALYG
jgi:uncharacterized protein